MKFHFKLRMFAALAAATLLFGAKTEAQGFGDFGLSVTSSASSLLVSNSLTYTITVTNQVGFLQDVNVSNTLPVSVQFVSANPGPGVTVTNYGSVTVFDIKGFDYPTLAQMTLTVRPTAVGFITNLVTVSAPIVTNTAATNIVTQITNITVNADLGVAITVPSVPVIVNDLTAYGIRVTNSGPDAVPGVVLTNTLPPGLILKSVSPTSPAYTKVGSNLVFNLGTLTNGGSKSFQLTIQPTNAAVLNFFASATAPNLLDPNLTNNTASNSLDVIDYSAADLVAVTNSAQIVNHQNGLIEQSILLSNIGTNDVTAARVVVTGLSNRLFNASGTNNGTPFVVYASKLAVNQSVTLLLQYAPRLPFPFADSQLQAFAVPVPDWTPPAAASTSKSLNITRLLRLASGNMLVEFPAITNRSYTVVYSDNVSFSNAMIAPPSIVAPANVIQWIDYGPPTTASAPTNSPVRFYRVFLNP